MKTSELIQRLITLRAKYGDLEIAIDVTSEQQIFELTGLVEWDTFEPGHPGYYVIETQPQDI